MKTEKKVPTFDELINPLFKALKQLGGSGSNDEIYEKVIELENFSDEILSVMHNPKSNYSEVSYRLAWARTYLKKYGVIDNTSRSIWVINNKYEKTNEFDTKELIKKVREIAKNSAKVKEDNNLENDGIEIPNEAQAWRNELKQILYTINPFEFEKLAQLILREAGFSQVTVTKRTGDGGIDGNGKFKINGIISFKLAFQCKRYSGLVTPDEIRDFRGSMTADVEKGVFITTGSFTKKAKEEASADGKKNIDLMDGEQLIDKLAELKLGIKEEKIYSIDKEFFEKFMIK